VVAGLLIADICLCGSCSGVAALGDQPSAQGVEATHLCGLVIGRVFWPIAGHTYVPDEFAPPFLFRDISRVKMNFRERV
jgi:hypothetical protein